MLNVIKLNVKNNPIIAECRYAECRLSECRGARNRHLPKVHFYIIFYFSEKKKRIIPLIKRVLFYAVILYIFS